MRVVGSLDWVGHIHLEDLAKTFSPLVFDPALRRSFLSALERTCKAFLSAQSPDQLSKACTAMLLLPKIGCGWWAQDSRRRRSQAKKVLEHYPFLSTSLSDEVTRALKRPRRIRPDGAYTHWRKIGAVRRHLRYGHLSKAARTLVSEGPAEADSDVIEQLRELHPAAPASAAKPTANLRIAKPNHPSMRSLDQVVKDLPNASAPGLSGWSYAMIKFAWKQSDDFRRFLLTLAKAMVCDTKVPCREWLAASRLIPLKKDGRPGVRPVACGESFTRVVSRWALRQFAPTPYKNCLEPEQFGVGEPAGVDSVIWTMRDWHRWAGGGVLAIDFSNAFNTISRRAMAEGLARDPKTSNLLPLFRLMYDSPSASIVIDNEGQPHRIECQVGGRQGDPLMPLLFSLACRDLVKELRERFAATADPEADFLTEQHLDNMRPHPSQPDLAEDPPERHLLAAYLDDIFIGLPEDIDPGAVLDYLQSLEVTGKFHLRLNRSKCRHVPLETLREVGMGVLGAWVGGPDDDSSPADKIFDERVAVLKSRMPLLDALPLQERLLLLRFCFRPVTDHLLRTLPPNVGLRGAADMDELMLATVLKWACSDAGVSRDTAAQLCRLPPRMGGLGLASQELLKPIACGSSFVLSQACLRERGMPVTAELFDSVSQTVRLCADNLDLPVYDLLSPDHALEPHLQRRCSELPREQAWKALFDSLPTDAHRLRLVESGSLLGRSWLRAIPSDAPHTLKNCDAEYALRRTLLSDFAETQDSTSPFCPACSCAEHALHHYTCRQTHTLTIKRHTAVKYALGDAIRQAIGQVDIEKAVGINSSTRRGTVADLRAPLYGRDLDNIDVVVYYPKLPANPEWPTADQAALRAAERALEPPHPTLFFWEDHSNEWTSEAVRVAQQFRFMCSEAVAKWGLDVAAARKHDKYGAANVAVIPFAISALGSVAPEARDVVELLTRRVSTDIGEQSTFFSRLVSRFSIALIHHAGLQARTLRNYHRAA